MNSDCLLSCMLLFASCLACCYYILSVWLQEETDAGSAEEVDGGGASSSPQPVPSKLDERLQVRLEGVFACPQ